MNRSQRTHQSEENVRWWAGAKNNLLPIIIAWIISMATALGSKKKSINLLAKNMYAFVELVSS